jgi:hypothetical protein
MKRDGIVGGFLELLAELQINPFFMEKVEEAVKEITVESGLDGVGKAYMVLDAVCKRLEIKPAGYHFIPDTWDAVDGGGGTKGFYLKPPLNHKGSLLLLRWEEATRSPSPQA